MKKTMQIDKYVSNLLGNRTFQSDLKFKIL